MTQVFKKDLPVLITISSENLSAASRLYISNFLISTGLAVQTKTGLTFPIFSFVFKKEYVSLVLEDKEKKIPAKKNDLPAIDDALYWLSKIGAVKFVDKAENGDDVKTLPASMLTKLVSVLFLSHYRNLFGTSTPGIVEDIYKSIQDGEKDGDLITPLSLARSLALSSLFFSTGLGSGRITSSFSFVKELTSKQSDKSKSIDEILDSVAKTTVISKVTSAGESAPSKGAVAAERTIVFQLKRDALEPNRFKNFLTNFSGKGIYLRQARPDSTFEKRLSKAFRDSSKIGFVQFSLEIDAGIETRHLISILYDSGAIKRRSIHHEEYGYHLGSTDSSLRFSEWLHLSGSSYQELGGLRSERLFQPLARVNRKL